MSLVDRYYDKLGTTYDWRDRGVAGWETGTRVEPPSIDERKVRALERIAAALERLALNRPNFPRLPEVTSGELLVDDDSTHWTWTNTGNPI